MSTSLRFNSSHDVQTTSLFGSFRLAERVWVGGGGPGKAELSLSFPPLGPFHESSRRESRIPLRLSGMVRGKSRYLIIKPASLF